MKETKEMINFATVIVLDSVREENDLREKIGGQALMVKN